METVGRAIGGAGTGRNRAGRWGNRGRIGGFDHGGGWRWRRSLGRSEVRGDLRFVEEDLADAILKTYTDVAFLEIVVEDFVAFERLAEAEPFAAFAFFVINAEFENAVDPANSAKLQLFRKRSVLGGGGNGENGGKQAEAEKAVGAGKEFGGIFFAAHNQDETAVDFWLF